MCFQKGPSGPMGPPGIQGPPGLPGAQVTTAALMQEFRDVVRGQLDAPQIHLRTIFFSDETFNMYLQFI